MFTKKRKAPLARQLKVKSNRTGDDILVVSEAPFDVVACAFDIKDNLAAHRHDVDAAAHACAAAMHDVEEADETVDIKDKVRQLTYMYRVLADKYTELVKYTVQLEAATELAITSRHQHAMEVARGDTESSSADALMSSVHRR